MARGAGNSAAFGARRRRLLRICGVVVCSALTACAELDARGTGADAGGDTGERNHAGGSMAGWLVAQPPVIGAPLHPGTNTSGSNGPSVARGYFKLANPIAVAASGPDIYVVDGATAALYRFDATAQTVMRVTSVRAVPGTRIVAAPDGTVYLLQAGLSSINRYSRDGRLLATLAAPNDLVRPTDLAIEDSRGLLWVADGILQQIVAFHPLGKVAYIVNQRGNVDGRLESGMRGMAAGPAGVFVVDPGCRCVSEIRPDGRGLRTFGESELVNPVAVAADRWGRVWVLDTALRNIRIFFDGLSAGAVSFGDLGVIEAASIAIHDSTLYVADTRGGRVGVFHLVSPAGGGAPRP